MRPLFFGNVFIAAIFVLAIDCMGIRAEDKPRKKVESFPVKVRVHHEPAKFDLAKEKDQEDFIDKAKHGEIDEIEIEKDPMKLDADLGLWAIVIFVALLLILRKFAWGPMVEGLQKREHSIRQAVDEAKLAREETERLRAQFKAEMDQAFAKIPAMMEEARRNAEKLAAELRTKATADIQAERERQRREIELAHDQALQDLCNQSAQLATLIAGNVLARTITPDDQERMLSIAMEELKNSGPRFRQDVI